MVNLDYGSLIRGSQCSRDLLQAISTGYLFLAKSVDIPRLLRIHNTLILTFASVFKPHYNQCKVS